MTMLADDLCDCDLERTRDLDLGFGHDLDWNVQRWIIRCHYHDWTLYEYVFPKGLVVQTWPDSLHDAQIKAHIAVQDMTIKTFNPLLKPILGFLGRIAQGWKRR